MVRTVVLAARRRLQLHGIAYNGRTRPLLFAIHLRMLTRPPVVQYIITSSFTSAEQYNPNFVQQVAAMEAKAAELGVQVGWYYM